MAVGLTGTLLVTEDGGASWRDVPPLTREHLLDIAWDENRWVAVGDKGVQNIEPPPRFCDKFGDDFFGEAGIGLQFQRGNGGSVARLADKARETDDPARLGHPLGKLSQQHCRIERFGLNDNQALTLR